MDDDGRRRLDELFSRAIELGAEVEHAPLELVVLLVLGREAGDGGRCGGRGGIAAVERALVRLRRHAHAVPWFPVPRALGSSRPAFVLRIECGLGLLGLLLASTVRRGRGRASGQKGDVRRRKRQKACVTEMTYAGAEPCPLVGLGCWL